MARPTHRLDLLLVPAHHQPIEQAHAALSSLVEAGVCVEGGTSGPSAPTWVQGGFGRIIVETAGRESFFANRSGGFRVACPACKAPVVEAFQRAMTGWRSGASRRLECSRCGTSHDLDALHFAPPAAFGAWAFVIVDASHFELTKQGRALAESLLGTTRLVWRRL